MQMQPAEEMAAGQGGAAPMQPSVQGGAAIQPVATNLSWMGQAGSCDHHDSTRSRGKLQDNAGGPCNNQAWQTESNTQADSWARQAAGKTGAWAR